MRPTSDVPLRYRKIIFTTCQCSLPRSHINRLTTLTDCARSGLVQTIAYIKLPTALAYGTRDMYAFSSADLGANTTDRCAFDALGVSMDLALDMPNLVNTFSIYPFCDKKSFFLGPVLLV
ncbi:hypothetical protein RND81_08G127500 [Saponaria officinalis]|uniref:Uncharacterized protein n=1 Tax=Saponaria officinalis TaxID=3572 RepID=A0AAW1J831_SAPOF